MLKLREVERGVTVIGTKTELAESAPRILQLHWLRMEAAEREYESTISKNLVDVETAMSKHAAEAKLAVLKTSLREQAARPRARGEPTSQRTRRSCHDRFAALSRAVHTVLK